MPDPQSAIYRSPQELAGEHYDEMVRSKEQALSFLSYPDRAVQLAATLVCQTTWMCGGDPRVVVACSQIADSDAEDSLRIGAIGCVGRALLSTKSKDTSQLLATLASDSHNSADVRIAAYWALRDVQIGMADDDFLRHLVYLTKSFLRDHPNRFAEQQVKSNLLGGRISDPLWDQAEDIDWNYVRQFLPTKHGVEQPK